MDVIELIITSQISTIFIGEYVIMYYTNSIIMIKISFDDLKQLLRSVTEYKLASEHGRTHVWLAYIPPIFLPSFYMRLNR